ncbi:MAG: hypothetical protein HC802_00745 [Caldilineaceae bacterium]|nr:hypothetical protein [Caldilineaceae bacterium]
MVTPFFNQPYLTDVDGIRCKLQLGNVSLTGQYGFKPQYLIRCETSHLTPQIPVLLQT